MLVFSYVSILLFFLPQLWLLCFTFLLTIVYIFRALLNKFIEQCCQVVDFFDTIVGIVLSKRFIKA